MATRIPGKDDEQSMREPMGTPAQTTTAEQKPGLGSTNPHTAGAENPVTGSAKPGGTRSPEERRQRISDYAYYRSERRGFAPGEEERDWLEAEKEVDGEGPGRLKPEDNTFPSPK